MTVKNECYLAGTLSCIALGTEVQVSKDNVIPQVALQVSL